MNPTRKGTIVPLRPRLEAPDDRVELVRRARAGDAGAQAELYRRNAPRITGLLVRLLGSHADAEDAAQETFVAALRDLKQLRDESALDGWLTMLAVHQAHRYFRKRKLLRTLGLDRKPLDGTLELVADRAASPETRAELALLDEVLAELPAKDRIAWMLRYVEGHELTEVARYTGASLATVKRRIAAAHARVTAKVAVGEPDA